MTRRVSCRKNPIRLIPITLSFPDLHPPLPLPVRALPPTLDTPPIHPKHPPHPLLIHIQLILWSINEFQPSDFSPTDHLPPPSLFLRHPPSHPRYPAHPPETSFTLIINTYSTRSVEYKRFQTVKYCLIIPPLKNSHLPPFPPSTSSSSPLLARHPHPPLPPLPPLPLSSSHHPPPPTNY